MALADLARLRLGGLFGPYVLARYSAVAALLCAVGFVWLSLFVPTSDTAFRAEPGGAAVVAATPDAVFRLRADRPVRFKAPDGGAFTVSPLALSSVEATADPQRQQLARALRDGPVQAEASDVSGQTRSFTVATRPAGLEDLSPTYWQSTVFGAISMLFGIAIWLIRRRDWAAACFAWVGIWLFASAFADALVELWNVATPISLVNFTLLANGATLHPFALSFVALFARFPSPIVPMRWLPSAMIATGLAAAATVALIPRNPAYSAGLQMAEYACLLALVVGQLWVNRRDPAKRPTLVIMVGSIAVGIVLYLLISLAPAMQGVNAPLGEAVAFPLFCLIYAGIGLSIVGSGVFTLDGWSRSIMLSITFSAVVLIVDLAVLHWLTRQQDVALGLSVAAVTLAWLPVREWLSRRAERRRDAQAQRALRLATDLAFAVTDEERTERWRAAVESAFRPLEIAPDPAPSAEPRIDELGVALSMPAVAGAPALVCRHADGGRRAFRRDDIEAANALVTIVARLVEARDAYVQGATEERGRIARDLHDNVSGRLITSLNRRDVMAMKHDVRDAMADIRTIITGLGGEERQLGELLADLRHECHTRCEAAGLVLDWPPGPELEDMRPVGYGLYRHLTALVRECVSNIIRHAGATRVQVDVTLAEDRLSATIADDGRGFSSGHIPGRGLANCVDRTRALGGSFNVLAVDRGAAVRFDVSWPNPPSAIPLSGGYAGAEAI